MSGLWRVAWTQARSTNPLHKASTLAATLGRVSSTLHAPIGDSLNKKPLCQPIRRSVLLAATHAPMPIGWHSRTVDSRTVGGRTVISRTVISRTVDSRTVGSRTVGSRTVDSLHRKVSA